MKSLYRYTIVLLVCTIVSPAIAHAWTRNPDGIGGLPQAQWPSPQVQLRVNSGNFVSNMPFSLTEEEWQAWIFYALSRWNVTTGLEWQFQFEGATTSNGCTQIADGENTIDAMSECVTPDCFIYAYVRRYRSSLDETVIIEADLCVSVSAATEGYGITDGEINTGRMDIIGVLTHEFGHFLDLGHTSNTVMLANAQAGSMEMRIPTVDDITGARTVYPGPSTFDRTRRWRRRNGTNSWSGATDIPSANQWIDPTGAIGGSVGHGDVVVVTGHNPTSSPVHLSRADYPLGGSSVWDNRTWSVSTLRRPAVSAGGASSTEWVAAIKNPSFLNACSGLQVLRSSDAFDSGTVVPLGDCTNYAPALAYDVDSSRFILAYVDYAPEGDQNRIMFRTSSDGGATWTTRQDTNAATFESPAISCGANAGCMLTFVRAWVNPPTIVAMPVAFDSTTGLATLGSANSNVNFFQHAPSVGYSSADETWLVGGLWSGDPSDRATGVGRLFVAEDPLSGFAWKEVASPLFMPPNLAVGSGFSEEYLVYVR